MGFLGEMIATLGWFVDRIFVIMYFALIIRIIMSWVGADPYNQIVQLVYTVTEPLLAPFRKLPLQFGMIDFSPILAFLVLSVLRQIVVGVIYGIARSLMG